MDVMDPVSAEDMELELSGTALSGICPQCGKLVFQKPKGRRKRFCSEECRFAWKNRHPNPGNWKSTRTVLCPVCGGEFLASREYVRPRKYCSRACANKGRAMERRRGSGTGDT